MLLLSCAFTSSPPHYFSPLRIGYDIVDCFYLYKERLDYYLRFATASLELLLPQCYSRRLFFTTTGQFYFTLIDDEASTAIYIESTSLPI